MAEEMKELDLVEVLGPDHGLAWLICSGIESASEAKKMASAFRGEVTQMQERLDSLHWPSGPKPIK